MRAALGGLVLAMAACRSAPPPPEPVSPEASALLARAARADRDGHPAVALEAAGRALELAPGWVAPRRLLDDWLREDLLGPRALAAHLQALETDPADAGSAYLAGRLEGPEGAARFRRAVRSDPGLAWGHHGRAWAASRKRRWSEAVAAQERAFAQARDSWERSYFASALARIHRAAGDAEAAEKVLRTRLAADEVYPVDADRLEYELCGLLLSRSEDRAARTAGFHRSREWLRSGRGTPAQARELSWQALAAEVTDSTRARELDLEAALQERGDRELLASFLEAVGPAELADALRPSVGPRPTSAERARRSAFESGDVAAWVEAWLAELPEQVLTDGVPADARLRAVVLRARALRRSDGAPDFEPLARACLAAGWFEEVLLLSRRMAASDLDTALELRRPATAALALVAHVRELLRAASSPEGRGGADAAELKGLEEVLAAAQPWVARLEELWPAAEARAWHLADSPWLSYGPAGRILHPGPHYNGVDEAEGRGEAGAPVPGWASVWAALGRFGLFGESPARPGPEGVTLQVLLVEDRAGDHLGAPWEGTVAWCEGRDMGAALSVGAGGHVAGAALHQGYWIDVEVIRREHARWVAFRDAWLGERSDAERAGRALEVAAAPLEGADGPADWVAPLGESERLRLAILSDRGAAPALDELLANTAAHEEGHLCDRARFLPISQHLPRVVAFLFRAGFSPTRVLAQLEYRAQLVALAEAVDPRLVLVDTLAMAESDDLGPHADAYRRLVRDFLAELERRAAEFPQLDLERYLMHQLSRLDAEGVRRVALALAGREGLVR